MPGLTGQERRNFRRGLLVHERNELAEKDSAEVKLRERLGRQAFLAQKAQHVAVVDQLRSVQALKEAKSFAKAAAKARSKLLDKVYGPESLIHRQSLPTDCPAVLSEMSLPGWENSSNLEVPVLPLRGFVSGGEPVCYVPALCQLLLRLPRRGVVQYVLRILAY